jgi:hypothetical protein
VITWIYKLFRSKSPKENLGRGFAKARQGRFNRLALWVEQLEDRRVPAIGMVPGANVNISQLLDNQAETTIAINPLAPQNLFVASVDWNGNTAGPGLFADYSNGSGAAGTWGNRTTVLASGKAGGDSLPAAWADPSAEFDQFGNLFLTYLTNSNGVLQRGTSSGNNGAAADKIFNDNTRSWTPGEWTGWTLNVTDAITGNVQRRTITANTKTQITVQTNWTEVPDDRSTYTITAPDQTIVVALSTDNGATFTWLAYVGTSGASLDKPFLATGPGGKTAKGSVWVTFKNNDQFIYATGAAVQGKGQVQKFNTPQKSLGSRDKAFSGIAVGPKGQVVISYQDGGPGKNPQVVGNIWTDTDPTGLAAGPGFLGAVKAV